MERSKKGVLGGVYNCYALFRSILTNNHGRRRQFWIGRVPQSEYPVDVKLNVIELTPKEGGLKEEDPVLFRSF